MNQDHRNLFAQETACPAGPLADRMRPCDVQDVVGQDHILGAGKPLREAIAAGHLHSMILWGPPGTGKTTLARLLAQQVNAQFIAISAVLAGVKDIRAAVESARRRWQMERLGTILFVDEVHRFNKAQQDAFLPFVEDGTVVFVGATTENPSFELNNALLSRARTYLLKPLGIPDIKVIIERALRDPDMGLGKRNLDLSAELGERLAAAADGDARRALNLLELAADLAIRVDGRERITEEAVTQVISSPHRKFDKGGDVFYDQISALHKSVRGSNPDAALYWMVRMLDGGCDPFYIARRVLRMASEDIGNADPRALQLALNAWDVQERLGDPEGNLAIAQAVLYLACAPKSNAVYEAFNRVGNDVGKSGSLEVPLHLRNAPTRLMKELGHGKGYRYAHDEPDGYAAGVNYFPEGMTPVQYYRPVKRGLEMKIAERLAQIRRRDRERIKT